jgi:hypothetical protein
LRSQGIILDADAALKKYADSLGLISSELNQSQKQQAILNAVLETGKDRFKDGTASVQPLADGLKRASVAFGDFIAQARIAANDTFGNAIARTAEAIASLFKAGNEANQGRFGQNLTEQATALRVSIIATEEKLKSLRAELAETPNSVNEINNRIILDKLISDSVLKLKELNAEFAATGATASNQTKEFIENEKNKQAAIQTTANTVSAITAEQLAQIQSRQSQAQQLQANLSQAVLKERLEDLLKLQQTEESKLAISQNIGEQLKNLKVLEAAEILEKEKQLRALGVKDEEEFAKARLNIAAKYEEDKKNLVESSNAAQIASNKAFQAQFTQILSAGLTNAFKDVGVRLQQGKGLFDNFGQGMAGIAGDMMITLGQAIIAQGIAATAFVQGLTTLSPVALAGAIALGAGLVIFGSALKSSVGLGSGSTADSASSSGGSFADSGVGTAPGTTTEIAGPEEREPSTEIVVNFEGDILGDESAGRRIVDLINSAFDSQGVKVRRGALA